MVKRKIRNTLTFNWSITRCGVPEDFTGRNVTVLLKHAYGSEAKISWTIENNVIHVLWAGADQRLLGSYLLICRENDGESDIYEVDHCEAVCLVEHSKDEGGESCSNIEVSPISLSSEIKVGQSGASAYEIAVKWGFVGTEQEWVKSLKGEKGDKGDVILPKFSVNEKMELVVDTDVPTDRFGIENGNLIINI